MSQRATPAQMLRRSGLYYFAKPLHQPAITTLRFSGLGQIVKEMAFRCIGLTT